MLDGGYHHPEFGKMLPFLYFSTSFHNIWWACNESYVKRNSNCIRLAKCPLKQ